MPINVQLIQGTKINFNTRIHKVTNSEGTINVHVYNNKIPVNIELLFLQSL